MRRRLHNPFFRHFVRAVLGLAVLALLFAPGGAVAEDTKAKPKPRNLREMGERLTALAIQIQKLIEVASKDPDEARIDLYRSYTPKQMKKTRGRVRAEDIVGYMLDPKKHFDVRQKAWKALQEGAQFRGDPELSKTEKQGTKSKRAHFCERMLTKQLLHEDRIARKMVGDLLTTLWFGRRSGIAEIDRYSPTDEKTWKPARRRWNTYLRKN